VPETGMKTNYIYLTSHNITESGGVPEEKSRKALGVSYDGAHSLLIVVLT